MMKSSSFKEDKNIKDNIIKNIKNHFTLQKIKKETNDTAIKDIEIFLD